MYCQMPVDAHGFSALGALHCNRATCTIGLSFRCANEKLEAPAVAGTFQIATPYRGIWPRRILRSPMEAPGTDGVVTVCEVFVIPLAFIGGYQQQLDFALVELT